MHDVRTNLISTERQRAFSREYLTRLGIVIVMLVISLSAAGAILLLPAYVYLSTSVSAKQAHLASIQSTLSLGDEAALSKKLVALGNDSAALLALQNAPTASGLVRDFLAISRAGVTLSNIRYTPSKVGKAGTLEVSGNALTRDALRNYQIALQGAPFSRGADLPVSVYAKDSNIPFTITITLAP